VQLAREDNVEISPQAVGDHLAHRYGAARDGGNQWILAAPLRQRFGQQFTGFDAITEDHRRDYLLRSLRLG